MPTQHPEAADEMSTTQTDNFLTERGLALRNQRLTRELLSDITVGFLELGRLLKDCRENRYWGVLGYGSFKDYIVLLNIPVVNSYGWAMRLIQVYELSRLPEAPQEDELLAIGVSKLSRLAVAHRRGLLTPALWDRARHMTDRQLIAHVKSGSMRRGLRSWQGLVSEDADTPHSELKMKILAIGEMLGMHADLEHSEGPYQFDVIWKADPSFARASHVFEVQVGGSVDEALAKLSFAHSHWSGPRLFLVVANDEDEARAKRLLVEQPLVQIASRIITLRPEEVDTVHRGFVANREILHRLLGI